MTDNHLRKDVLDELAFEPSLNAAHIGVSAEDGIVSLTGHVDSYAEKTAAEDAAGRVRGVRAVVQELTVVPPGGACSSDEEIAHQVLSALEWDSHIPADAIKVKVESGWVTLSGELDSYFQRRGAEDAIRSLRCVTGVTNKINMRPDAGAEDIEARIAAVLLRNRHFSGHDIRATAFGGMVTLTGAVNCLKAKKETERAVWSVAGVQWVDNKLTVESAAELYQA